jgi:diguanylate cyclase (GGDEF)-like protein
MKILLANLEKLNKPTLITVGFVFIAVIGFFDFLTGYEFSFSLFYILPVSLIAWGSNRKISLLTSVASAIVWLIAEILSGRSYSNNFSFLWNTIIRSGIFFIVALLLLELRGLLYQEKIFSSTDYLTTAINSRRFYEMLQDEINRSQRNHHPFTIAYLDVDDFKYINDHFGHDTGDNLLRLLVASIKESIRKTDTVARLGGDEFIILLPETDQQSAIVTFTKIQLVLVDKMKSSGFFVTFSTGVLTCIIPTNSSIELVRLVDELMYLVKKSGKNNIRYSVYPS